MAVHHDDPPPGYRFRPDTEQLLVHYLRPMLDGQPYPQGLVPFCDLYGDQEPHQIWDTCFKQVSHKDQERTNLYFITRHKTKTPKGKRISRTVGGGTWKGNDAAEKVISASSRRVIGRRKRFHFKKERSEHSGRWLMHEFELDASTLLARNRHKAKEYVLCILRKNNRSVKKKYSAEEEEEEEEEDDDDQEKDGMSCDYGGVQDGGELLDPQSTTVAEETNRIQNPDDDDDLRKHVMVFEEDLMKEKAENAMKKSIHHHKEYSHRMSLEELEGLLMS